MKPPNLTVEAVVEMARRHGPLEVNPLKYRKWRGTDACFQAAREGLLKKERINCGRFRFYYIEKT